MTHLKTTAAARFGRGMFFWSGAACLLAALTAGCRDSAKPSAGTQTETPAQTEAQCADLLQSVLGLFRLQDLGVTTDIDHGISILNQWQRLCQKPTGDEFELPAEVRSQLANLLSSDELARVQRTLYSKRDGEHLRDCLLYRAVQGHAAGKADRDLGRVINLFQHVAWNVQLVESHPDDAPLSPYETYLTGRGTAEDRAWLFAELLRQLRIDAVILQPRAAGEQTEARRPFLVGILLENEVFLFDPALGLPILALDSPAATGPEVKVATLTQVQADPAILKQFDLDPQHPYPLAGAELKSPAVAAIGDTSFWAPRMEQLQPAFTGASAMVIYDGLATASGPRGVLARVAALQGHGWDSPATVWPYPERQLTAYENMTALQEQAVLSLTAPLSAPYVPRMGQDKNLMLVPERIQFRARIAQAQGDFENAIKDFTFVQLRSHLPPQAQVNPEFLRLHQTARADATFWIGVSKLAQGKPADRQVAQDKFRQYLRDNPEGFWVTACRQGLAQLEAEKGNREEAVKLLEEIPADHPQHLGYLYLIKKWQGAAKSAEQ
jgi:hypothetical protein